MSLHLKLSLVRIFLTLSIQITNLRYIIGTKSGKDRGVESRCLSLTTTQYNEGCVSNIAGAMHT
jgi:hypothetical protein